MATPAERSSAASLASDISWARTPDRNERTAPARAASPVSYGYWLNKITAEGVVRPQDRAKAAESAHRAYMKQLSRKAADKRKEKAAEKAA